MDKFNQSEIQISVVIPVYNREKEIVHCLSSLVATTFDKKKLEVIVIDDASTDQTVAVVRSFADKFNHFQIHTLLENSGGASVPRNVGIKEATGEWLLFIDSDDALTSYALEEAYQLATANDKTDLVCLPYYRAEGGKRPLSSSCFQYTEPVNGLRFIETKLFNSLNIIGKLMRKSCVDRYQLSFPEGIRVREDNWFSMKLYSVVREIAFLGNQKDYYFYGERDELSLSKIGTPPRDALAIYVTVFHFIWQLEEQTQKEKQDYLAIYLNRYRAMIQRGKYSPSRLFDKTQTQLPTLLESDFLDSETRRFIQELMAGKYSIK
ncbi:hypothetical protein IGI37_003210 [Enterococcus sp. AZ194]|uniref:glycosyltransferase family 2 protein n=1 Tax=Enterococcus sp. AZ194 TaxID=2774629 RepID=UPI003F27BE68